MIVSSWQQNCCIVGNCHSVQATVLWLTSLMLSLIFTFAFRLDKCSSPHKLLMPSCKLRPESLRIPVDGSVKVYIYIIVYTFPVSFSSVTASFWLLVAWTAGMLGYQFLSLLPEWLFIYSLVPKFCMTKFPWLTIYDFHGKNFSRLIFQGAMATHFKADFHCCIFIFPYKPCSLQLSLALLLVFQSLPVDKQWTSVQISFWSGRPLFI